MKGWTWGSGFLLILDDFHVIQDEAILRVLRTLAGNIPPALHLVLIMREEPSLPLAGFFTCCGFLCWAVICFAQVAMVCSRAWVTNL
ncbi:MAG: hypothetical protein ACK2U5_24100 [Candidatus Promineifilaceae bacterium]